MVVAPGAAMWSALVRRARPIGRAEAERMGPWLVLAPHPDDESLGPGGLTAMLARRGAPPRIAYLTDGARSHEGAPGWSARRIVGARRVEATQALRILGVRAAAVHLDWPDASPWLPGSAPLEATVRRLGALCRRYRIRALATTWAGDPHCDHVAAATIAVEVARCARGRVRVYAYPVWGWTGDRLGASAEAAITIPLSRRERARQWRAVHCHRTQVSTRISGAARAFRLPRAVIALTRRPRLILLRTGTRHAA